MFKTIVVGTDGSERADVAVDHAIALAWTFGSELHVVHAVQDRPRDPTVDAATRAHREVNLAYDEADVVTASALDRARAQGVRGEAHSPVGDPGDMLVTIAEACHADLVVVGNRGISGLRRLVLGSVPSRIAHRCPCDLLIVDTEDVGRAPATGA